jgi:hypothetical protein
MAITRRIRFTAQALALGLVLVGARTAWAAGPLPPGERLDPVRPALQKLIDQTERAGAPADLIVSKVREGLAKGVPPETIRSVAEQLARDLGEANDFLREHRKTGATPNLVRGLVEARTSGIPLAAMAALIESHARDALVVRGLESVTDLGLRGYPAPRAAMVVAEVLERDPDAIGRVVAGIESIRRTQTVSRAEALDALLRNMNAPGTSLEGALNRSLEGSEHSANGNGNGKNGQGNEHAAGVAGAKSNNGNMNGKNK